MFFLGLFVCWSVCHQAKSQVVKKIISVSFFFDGCWFTTININNRLYCGGDWILLYIGLHTSKYPLFQATKPIGKRIVLK